MCAGWDFAHSGRLSASEASDTLRDAFLDARLDLQDFWPSSNSTEASDSMLLEEELDSVRLIGGADVRSWVQ